jgi:hypothetical protein
VCACITQLRILGAKSLKCPNVAIDTECRVPQLFAPEINGTGDLVDAR